MRSISSIGLLAVLCLVVMVQPGQAAQVLTGSVASVISGSMFSLQAGLPYGHVPVNYSPSVVIPQGTVVDVGDGVSVSGSFNRNGSFSAISVRVASTSTSGSSSGSAHYHIATWGYDNYWAQGQQATAADVNRLLTFAQGNDKSVNDCHSGAHLCRAVYYVNPNHEYGSSPVSCVSHPDADVLAVASESWFIHNVGYVDAAHRVHGKNGSCTIFEMNPFSVGLQNWWRSYLRTHANSYDTYFIDNSPMDIPDAGYFPSGGGCNPWPSVCVSTHEIATNVIETFARAAFASSLSHSNGSPMYSFYQQASFNPALDVSAFRLSKHLVGVSCEGCISTYAAPSRPGLFANVLTEMAAVDASSGSFLLISHGSASTGSPTQTLQRMVTIGITWLGYSEGHTVVQSDLEANTTRLAVWPEDLLYPASPLQSMRLGASDLLVSAGVYRREFASCYQQGVAIGPCAAVVNANSHAVTVRSSWFRQAYGHVVTLRGGDVLAGGVAEISSVRYIPNGTALQAADALLLTR